MKLLERDPRARYQSASELYGDLEGYRSSGAGDKRSIPVTDMVNILFPSDSHLAMAHTPGSMVSGSASISVNTPGFDVDSPTNAIDGEADVPLQFMHDDDPQRPVFPTPRDMAATPPPTYGSTHGSKSKHSSMHASLPPAVSVPVLTVDQGVSMKLILAVTLACLVGSLIFWFAVF